MQVSSITMYCTYKEDQSDFSSLVYGEMSGHIETFALNFTKVNSAGNGTGGFVFTSTRPVVLSIIVQCLGAFTIVLCGLICTIQVRAQELHKVSNFVMLNSLIADLVSGIGSIMFINVG